MMMSEKPPVSFSKVKKLITVLQKCSGQAVIDGSSALISPQAVKLLVYGGLLALAAALFAGVYFIQPMLAGFIGLRTLTQALMMILLIMSFVLSVKDIVTVLYTADDLALLLPMPFSADQIVLAKLAVVSVFPVTFSVIVLNAVCLGYGIRAGAGVPFFIGIVLSSVLIPVTGICAAALLIVVLFRLFGFIRNRDITVAAGGIFTFALSFAYIFINRAGREGAEGTAAAAGLLSSAASVFPNISFMSRFLFEGSISGLLISLAFPLVLFAAAVCAVRAFYFDTALSMKSTGTGRKAVSKDMLHGVKKNGALKALTAYEAKSARRNPAYLIYGFAISFLWPVLVILPLVLGNDSLLAGAVFPLGTMPALLAILSFAAAASCFSCGFNILSGTAFSREGSSFAAIRALPVDPSDYCRSKRNFALLICSCGSVLYVAAAGIAGVAAGWIALRDSWIIPAGAFLCFLLNRIFIDLMLLKNSKKPQLNWDSEAELSRKLGVVNVMIIVAGVFWVAFFMAPLALGELLNSPSVARIILIVCSAAGLLILILAILIDQFALKAAAANLMKLE